MPNLNKLHEQFGEDGLVIVGVSNEGANLISNAIEKHGVKYPMALVKGDSADRAYKVRAFPTMVTVGPDGTIVSRGHPNAGNIRRLLKDVVLVPSLTDSKHKGIQKLLDSKQFGKAHAKLARALEGAEGESELNEAHDAIVRLADVGLAGAERLQQSGAWYRSIAKLESVEERFSGMAQAERAAELRKSVSKNPAAKDDLSAGALLKKAQAQIAKGKKANVRKGEDILARIVDKFPSTDCAKVAREMMGK